MIFIVARGHDAVFCLIAARYKPQRRLQALADRIIINLRPLFGRKCSPEVIPAGGRSVEAAKHRQIALRSFLGAVTNQRIGGDLQQNRVDFGVARKLLLE